MGKYKAGDKVVLRKDLKVDEVFYGDVKWTINDLEMVDLKYVVLVKVIEDEYYRVKYNGNNGFVSDEMIESLYVEDVAVTNELKLFEVCYLDENFNEHQFLKVAINEESALELVNDSMVNIFATEITEVDGYKIKLCK